MGRAIPLLPHLYGQQRIKEWHLPFYKSKLFIITDEGLTTALIKVQDFLDVKHCRLVGTDVSNDRCTFFFRV
jgi:hypothetical protein